jgi:hypothetical protein
MGWADYSFINKKYVVQREIGAPVKKGTQFNEGVYFLVGKG